MALLDSLIEIDKRVLLALNGSDSIWLDNVMLVSTKTWVWIPLLCAILFLLWKKMSWKHFLFIILMLGLTVLVCDQLASGLCKPLFERFRPSKDPELEGLVQLVSNYKGGGLYGFCSSHAANSFGIIIFLILVMRNKISAITLILWALLHSYTRIYLGVHFPGDVLCGTAIGVVSAYLIYALYSFCCAKLSVRINAKDDSFAPYKKYSNREAVCIPITFFAILSCIFIAALFL